MVEAQRFPWNFDGILAMEPSSVTASGVLLLWNSRATHDEDGNRLFTPADRDVLHAGPSPHAMRTMASRMGSSVAIPEPAHSILPN